MQIIEQTIVPKSPSRKSEDGIVVTDDFVAVIDGSTSKSQRRYSLLNSNGRYAMLLISRYLRRMPKTTTCRQFCQGVTAYVRRHYRRSQLEHLAQHPEDRLCASAVVYSRVCREVWLVGDCQCLIGGELYDNPKPSEAAIARRRAEVARQYTEEQLREHDYARDAILPDLIASMKQQNVGYAVIDGFPIPPQHVRTITLDFQPWELVLASDGYPRLLPTLAESEAALEHQRLTDPLNIGAFQATKAFMQGCHSFDDRAYIRLKV